MALESPTTPAIPAQRSVRRTCYLACLALFSIAVAYNAELIVRPMPYHRVFAPAPVPVVLPFWFGVGNVPVLVAWVAAFVLWNGALQRGDASTPVRSFWLWGICAALSLWAFGAGWHYGLRFQGRLNMQIWLLASIGMAVASLALLLRARRVSSYSISLAAHTLLWLWPVTFAMPWLGEG